MSKIQWTDETWNPVVGCSVVSPGCTNCYAMRQAARLLDKPGSHYHGTTESSRGGPVWTGKVALAPEHIVTAPLRWRKPRRVFVNSMGDLFHEDVPDEWIDKVFAVMALSPQHQFQVLTKRAERMREYVNGLSKRHTPDGNMQLSVEVVLWQEAMNLNWFCDAPGDGCYLGLPSRWPGWPLSNVWLGVSAEDQRRADERIPALLDTPAAVRFLSAEPLLGPVNLTHLKHPTADHVSGAFIDALNGMEVDINQAETDRLDWVIVGGESGPGARPCDLAWIRSILAQCRAAGVPCFVKQLGACPVKNGRPLRLRDSKGGDWHEWPDDLRVRDFPRAETKEAA